MRKGKSIIGLKVLAQADGADLGKVKDLIFDHESDELLALLISDKDLFGLIDAQIVPWNQVLSVGPDAIVVPASESKIKAGDDARVRNIMERQTALSGTRIFTTDGQELGTLADMYIDEETGQVLGYEISTGFISDTMSGKRYMPAHGDLAIGEDVAMVPPEVAAHLEAQAQNEPGGLKATAANVGDKISTAYDAAKDKATDVYSNIATASVEKQKEFVVGKTAARDVIISADKATMTTPETIPASTTTFNSSLANPEVAPTSELASSELGTSPSDVSSSGEAVSGEVLVRQGEVITQQHAERAEAAGVLGQLVIAAGGGAASEAFSAGKEKVGGVVASGSNAAGAHAAGLQNRAEEAAIGKTAGREVVAADGSTIVAPGMTITQDIMDLARARNKEREVVAAAGVGAATETMSAAKEQAAGVWDTIKQKAAELTGAAHDKKAELDEQAQQNRINNALGRPVTRVILDQSDAVILNTGDLITHAAVNRAREADALEILLDSVYTADPEITPEMLRAREPGEAALPTQAQPSGGPITATVASENDSPSQPAQPAPAQGA